MQISGIPRSECEHLCLRFSIILCAKLPFHFLNEKEILQKYGNNELIRLNSFDKNEIWNLNSGTIDTEVYENLNEILPGENTIEYNCKNESKQKEIIWVKVCRQEFYTDWNQLV